MTPRAPTQRMRNNAAMSACRFRPQILKHGQQIRSLVHLSFAGEQLFSVVCLGGACECAEVEKNMSQLVGRGDVLEAAHVRVEQSSRKLDERLQLVN